MDFFDINIVTKIISDKTIEWYRGDYVIVLLIFFVSHVYLIKIIRFDLEMFHALLVSREISFTKFKLLN